MLKTTVKIIDEAQEVEQEVEHREHLGGSLIGHPCMRHIYYSFRWYKKERFNGRMLRLFDRGHEEEDRFARFLKAAGVKAQYVKPEPQKRFFLLGSHFSCEIDGILTGLHEAPKTEHVAEFKTYNDESFLKLVGLTKKKYKEVRDTRALHANTKANKPRHYAQMQVGMGMAGLERAYYLAVNKNDDCLAQERVEFDSVAYETLLAKAETIIFTPVLPPRISDRPSWYECKFCLFKDICHGAEAPEKNCRTCKFSKPQPDGTWWCKSYELTIPTEQQRKEHECHASA